jgi:hypothetical protein
VSRYPARTRGRDRTPCVCARFARRDRRRVDYMQNMLEILILAALFALGAGAVVLAGEALDRGMPLPGASAGVHSDRIQAGEVMQADADGVPDVGISDLRPLDGAHRHELELGGRQAGADAPHERVDR